MRSLTLDGCKLIKERCPQSAHTQSAALRRYSRDTQAKPRSQPSPAQLLRFALTNSTRVRGSNHHNYELDGRLTHQFQKKRLPKRSETIRNTSRALHNNFTFPVIKEQDGLSKLHSSIENTIVSEESGVQVMSSFSSLQNAFQRCGTRVEKEDSLATINGLLSRLRRLSVDNTEQLLLLGMMYAAEKFSVLSLQHYIQQYCRGGYGTLAQSVAVSLVKLLSNGLQLRTWEDPKIDKTAMLNIVVGLDTKGQSRVDSLHSLLDLSKLHENQLVPHYVSLLGELGGLQSVSDIWPKIQTELNAKPNPTIIQSTVSSIEAFLRLGRPKLAIDAAQETSKYIDLNKHLSAMSWKGLLENDTSGVLRSLVSLETTMDMIRSDLGSLELILGATWTGSEKGGHLNLRTMKQFTSTSDPENAYVSNCDLPEDSLGLDFARQIQIATQIEGYSRSRGKLSIVADLLNELEGMELRLQTKEVDGPGPFEFAWFVQCSAVEFIGNRPQITFDMDQPPSTASLGLISLRVNGHGVPLKSAGDARLMQLGYVGARNIHSEKWKATGHIVCLDRRNGKFVMLWIGKGQGAISPGLINPTPPPELPFTFGQITLDEKLGLKLAQSDEIWPLNYKNPYWVDVDPGSDLL